MNSLYLDRKGLELRHQGKALLLYQDGHRRESLPMNLLDRVVIRGAVQTSTGTLGALVDEGISVNLTTGRFGHRQATLVGPLHKDARRRIAQYQAFVDPHQRDRIARLIVRHKLASQLRLIRHARRQRPDLRHPLSRALELVEDQYTRLQSAGLSIQTLRGMEGAAGAAYFGAYQRLFPESLGFTARRRRPPPDPVNAVLSLGYTLLHSEAIQAIHQAGLDPYLGFLHELDYGRESLASDLIEPLRVRVDRLAWKLFRRRQLVAEHFSSTAGACLMNKAGRAVFYPAYESRAGLHRRWMRRALNGLVRGLTA